jgi:HEAT repeat protein
LKDGDSGVRYWGAMGALMRGAPAVRSMHAGLVAALDDSSASVRIAAAEALALFGEEGARGPALDALQAAADPTVTSAYAALAALNAIEALGPRAESIRAAVRSQPDRDPRAPARANGYVGRLRAQLPPPASP